MKRRKTYIGTRWWRLRIRPWGTYLAAAVFITLTVAAVVLAVYLLNGEAAS